MDTGKIQQFRKQLRKLERSLFLSLEGDAVCCGVTVSQCHVLMAVEEMQVATVTELAKDLGLDKSTLSRTIDGLVLAGFLDRQVNAENRRSQNITLTEAGREMAKAINDQGNRYFENLFAAIPEINHDMVIEGISIVADALMTGQGRCCQPPQGTGREDDGSTEQ